MYRTWACARHFPRTAPVKPHGVLACSVSAICILQLRKPRHSSAHLPSSTQPIRGRAERAHTRTMKPLPYQVTLDSPFASLSLLVCAVRVLTAMTSELWRTPSSDSWVRS